MPAYRSRTSTHGRNMAGARALWRATGMKDNDFGKPIIAVVNSFTQFVPGHVHLKDMGQLVARQIEAAGGVAKEFNTIAVDDGIAMGHGGMLYSLPSRELIADSVEYMVNAHCADAMVCISNCDKITPGMLMAAMRLNIPAVFVSGGPMEAGKVKIQGQVIHLDLVLDFAKDELAALGLDDLGDLDVHLLVHAVLATFDDDHRAVVEVADRLAGLLARLEQVQVDLVAEDGAIAGRDVPGQTVAVHRLGRMQEQRGCPRARQRGGDLPADDARLAHAREDHPATAGAQQLDRLVEPAVDARDQREDRGCLGLENLAREVEVSHGSESLRCPRPAQP